MSSSIGIEIDLCSGCTKISLRKYVVLHFWTIGPCVPPYTIHLPLQSPSFKKPSPTSSPNNQKPTTIKLAIDGIRLQRITRKIKLFEKRRLQETGEAEKRK